MNTYTFENIKDLDLQHIFECGQCFRWVPAGDGTPDYIGAAGKYAARISHDLNLCRLTVTATGGDEEFWHRYFDLDTDYSAIKERLVASEPGIEKAVTYGGGIRILNQDPFETIISFIISQNNNIPRIRKNIESLCRAYGEPIEGSSLFSFPSPEALADADVDDLAGLRLGYRSGYIKASAERYLREGCPECREELLAFHGIGPKVANCIMLFGLRDTAAFPIDTWVKQIMNDMYGFDLKDTKGMQAFAAEKYGDLAGYAQQYLFYYYRDRSRS
jgi:N-glycosylase/DNA lyase